MKAVVIGTGRMGRRHMHVLRSLNLELCGICDVHPETLLSAAREFGLDEGACFLDAGPMLAQLKPDLVIVATTAPSHCQYVCLAAENAAQYIFCEKPMAVSITQCRRMLEICARHNARLAVNHQMRFMDQYIFPKRFANSDEFGGLASVTIVAGNFGIAMNGTHYFEMFRYLTDEQPESVTAWFSSDRVPNPRGIEFEDVAGSVRIVTKSGKRFYMDVGSDQGHGMKVVYGCRNGQIVVDELDGWMQLSARNTEHRELPTTRYGMPHFEKVERITPADAVEPTRRVLEALLNKANYPDGITGLTTVKTLVSAYLSNESNHTTVGFESNLLMDDRVFPWA